MQRSAFDTLGYETGSFRRIFETLPAGILVADLGMRPLIVNATARRIFGANAANISGPEWTASCGVYRRDRVTPFEPEALPLYCALQGAEVDDELLFVRNADNPEGLWVCACSRPLLNGEGQIQGAVALYYDVTETRNSLERIRMLSRVVDHAGDSVVVTNRDGVIEYVNPEFERTTGFSREEAIGHTPRILKSGHTATELYDRLWHDIRSGDTFRGTLLNRKKSGEVFWAEQTISPVSDDAGEITHFVSLLKDVTELRKHQQQEITLKLARAVQQRLYAQPVSPGGFEIGVSAHPADMTGGDYIDVITNSGGSLVIAIGDVSGHGIEAALMMTLTRAYVRAFISLGMGAAEVLERMNNMLMMDLGVEAYVTLLLVQIELRSNTLTYSSAGHVSGFILDADGDAQFELSSTGLPLGMFGDKLFVSNSTNLHAGDTILLLTDGASETANSAGQELGTRPILEFVRQHRKNGSREIAEAIFAVAREFAQDEEQLDDVTCAIIKILR